MNLLLKRDAYVLKFSNSLHCNSDFKKWTPTAQLVCYIDKSLWSLLTAKDDHSFVIFFHLLGSLYDVNPRWNWRKLEYISVANKRRYTEL